MPEAGESLSSSDDLGKIITAHPFLKGLSPHHFRLLTDCAMLTTFQPGEVVFNEGDPANRFYLIRNGLVSIECRTQEAAHKQIQTVTAGDVLGWSWLFAPYYWHFDARALERTEAIFFYGTPLRAECESDHNLGYELVMRMAEVMARRLQNTRRQLIDVKSFSSLT